MLENIALKRQLDWFKQQLFGSTSERQPVDSNPDQPLLTGLEGDAVAPLPERPTESITYERGKASKHRREDCITGQGLRFGPEVPVRVIEVTPSELSGPEAGQYDVVDVRKTYRLAQRPASYEVLCYEHPVLKRRDHNTLITLPAPASVLEECMVDVSLLTGMLVDKFLYHLPLYRQHQRLQQAGIDLSRATLTRWGQLSIELLKPIVDRQLESILDSRVVSMDETPIRAGPSKTKRGMKQGWYWPVLGEADEIVFTFSPTRGSAHVTQVLQSRTDGVLLTDGYVAYERYVAANEAVVHAQCWVHGRRYFIKAQDTEREACESVLNTIGHLYALEAQLRETGLEGEKKRAFRLEHSKPVVDVLFAWLAQQRQRPDLLPSHPLSKAVEYMLAREAALRVFLEHPEVPMDNNHTERALRPIPLGRKNWLFCWTELGAEQVGLIQSLIVTCKLQGIDPYHYLVDVLQRVGQHPAKEVQELTPRVWKQTFADAPLRSDLAS